NLREPHVDLRPARGVHPMVVVQDLDGRDAGGECSRRQAPCGRLNHAVRYLPGGDALERRLRAQRAADEHVDLWNRIGRESTDRRLERVGVVTVAQILDGSEVCQRFTPPWL